MSPNAPATPIRINSKFQGNCRCGAKVPAGVPVLWLKGAKQLQGCPACMTQAQEAAAQAPRRHGAAEAHAPAAEGDLPAAVRIETVKFASEDGSWVTARCRWESEPDAKLADVLGKSLAFTVVGPLGINRRAGDVLDVRGRVVVDPKWGQQLKCSVAVLSLGASEDGVQKFLQRLPDIGPARARALLRALGGREGVLAALESGNASYLTAVNGITPERAETILNGYRAMAGTRTSMLRLAELGVPNGLVDKAIAKWGHEAAAEVEKDPYALMQLPGCGFATADKVALRMMKPGDVRRCKAIVLHLLEGQEDEGHVWTPSKALCGCDGEYRDLAADVHAMRVSDDSNEVAGLIAAGIDALGPDAIEVLADGQVALAATAHAEREVVRHLRRLMAAEGVALDTSGAWAGTNGTPDPAQAEAVEMAASSQVLIITGGPGVGKTHTCSAVLRCLQAGQLKVLAACPTGKAAVRLSEQTGLKASTIHRMLGYGPTGHGFGFRYNEGTKLQCDAVLLDEASMVSVHLFCSVLEAIPDGARLIIVGDQDQLPSIGPGRILADLIASGELPVARLTKIWRQASESSIPWICKLIREGQPFSIPEGATDAEMVEESDPDEALNKVVRQVTSGMSNAGIQSRNVQVIVAQKTRTLGVENLNLALQNALNPGDDGLKIGRAADDRDILVREGDRVIHTKNNYALGFSFGGVMNGMQGYVVAIDPKGNLQPADYHAETSSDAPAGNSDDDDILGRPKHGARYVLVVQYDDGIVAYTRDEANQVQLSYAITCHKSQGSQWQGVVFVGHSSMAWMNTRQLVYTAVSRPSKRLVVVGESAALAKAARNTRGQVRRTRLMELLRNRA